jgi:ankyrin repeat protein
MAPIAFAMIEIITAMIALVIFVPSFLIYPGVVIYRNYALLRDIKPLYCMLNHFAALLFNTHLMLGWRHQEDLPELLAVFQLIGDVFFFGFFVCKHYTLCQRYETDARTPLPSLVVFALASFPFAIIFTYRLSIHEMGYSDVAAGVVALFLLALVRMKFWVPYHPSPHFRLASRLELVVIFFVSVTAIIHQFIIWRLPSNDSDIIMIILIIFVAVLVNANFMAYVVPPLLAKFRHRDEYTVHSNFNLNGGGSPLLDDGASPFTNNNSITDTWFGRIACKIIPKKPSTPLASSGSPTPNPSLAGNSIGKSAAHLGGGPSTTFFGRGSSASGANGSIDSGAGAVKMSAELTHLLELIGDGDVKRVQQYISRTRLTVIHEADIKGRTPLHHAVAHGDIPMIRFLIQMGADRNQVDACGYAPLHDAVRLNPRAHPAQRTYRDQSNVVSELLEGGTRGAMVNQATPGGMIALHYAVLRDALGTLHTLLRYDANPLFNHEKEDPEQNWEESHCGTTVNFDTCRRSPLMMAVELGLERHVSSMLASLKSSGKKNTDIRCPHGLTLLHIALSLGHSKVVHTLLSEFKANPMAIFEKDKQNALHFAAMGGSCDATCQVLDALSFPDVVAPEMRIDPQSSIISPSTPTTNLPRSEGPRSETRISSMRASSTRLFPTSLREDKLVPQPPLHSRAMTTGEALAVIHRHIPGFAMDSKKLDNMESRVDHAVVDLKHAGMAEEAARLQHAMITLNRRWKYPPSMMSKMSLEFFPSTGASQITPESPALTLPAAGPGGIRPVDLLWAKDNQGMTPMQHAIRNANSQLVTIFACVGTAMKLMESPSPSPPSHTQRAIGSFPKDFPPLTLEASIAAQPNNCSMNREISFGMSQSREESLRQDTGFTTQSSGTSNSHQNSGAVVSRGSDPYAKLEPLVASWIGHAEVEHAMSPMTAEELIESIHVGVGLGKDFFAAELVSSSTFSGGMGGGGSIGYPGRDAPATPVGPMAAAMSSSTTYCPPVVEVIPPQGRKSPIPTAIVRQVSPNNNTNNANGGGSPGRAEDERSPEAAPTGSLNNNGDPDSPSNSTEVLTRIEI